VKPAPIRPAPWWVRAFLRAAGAYGITMPWRVIYLMPDQMSNAGLIRHEQAHVMQIERDGAWRWTVRVFCYLLRYGYKNSPYEEEARTLSGH
jgi:hypothetical protein